MTVVVAVVDTDGEIHMGGDSSASDEEAIEACIQIT